MLLSNFLPLTSLLLTTTSVTAWNTDVHNQIGFMAEKFLTHETTKIVQKILEPTYKGSIGRAAGKTTYPKSRFCLGAKYI